MRLQSGCGSNAQNGQAAGVPSEWMTVAEIPPTKYTAAALLGGVVASAGLVIAQQVIKNNAAGKAEVSTDDLIAMLEGNIAEQEKELASKNEELSAMKKEIGEMEESIEETNKLIVQLRAAEALEEAERRKTVKKMLSD